MRITSCVAVVALLVAALHPNASRAASAELSLGGVSVRYVAGQIVDDGSADGGFGDFSLAAALSFVGLYVEGVGQGSLASDVGIDILIQGVGGIPDSGGAVRTSGNGGDFGFDVLTFPGFPGWGLSLQIDTVELNYDALASTLSAAGVATSIFVQDLPFGVVLDESQPVSFGFEVSLSNVQSSGEFLTEFSGLGTGYISGTTTVPEPVSGLSALLGLALLAAGKRRSQRTR